MLWAVCGLLQGSWKEPALWLWEQRLPMTFWEVMVQVAVCALLGAGFGYLGFGLGRSSERHRAFLLLDTRIQHDEKVNSCCKDALVLSQIEVITGTKNVLVHTRDAGVTSAHGREEEKA
jgi:hypothetical protein